MNVLFKIIWIYLILLPFAGVHTKLAWAEPSAVIFDTDISSDVDDVGAVAVLHSLAKEGKVQILAMMVSSGDPWSVPCLRALNIWYGRGDISVGQVKGKTVIHKSKYTESIAREFGTPESLTNTVDDAVALYRRVLAAQPDNSVTIVTVGYLTNLYNLLNSLPDEYSPLPGMDLVSQKVKTLITMGGEYPEGHEWNFYQDAEAAISVVGAWPKPIDFIGYEVGLKVLTGEGLRGKKSQAPVVRAYQLYNKISDRPSWDQIAVLMSVDGNKERGDNLSGQFLYSATGTNFISADGTNRWNGQKGGSHRYVRAITSEEWFARNIENRMLGKNQVTDKQSE